MRLFLTICLFEIIFGLLETRNVRPTIKEVIEDTRLLKDKLNVDSKENDLEGIRTIGSEFFVNGQYHYTMETLTTVGTTSDQGIEIFSSTQWPDSIHAIVAKVVKVLESSVIVHSKPVGGGYGMKISRSNFSAAVCAIGVVLSKCPVRFIMTIEENMTTMGKRSACYSDYKVKFETDGKILAVNSVYKTDSGCSSNENYVPFIGEFFGNCYNRSVWPSVGEYVVTQSPCNTWCRAPGSVESIAMTENIVEHVAWTLNKDPADVRIINIPSDNPMKQLLPQFLLKVG